MPYGLMNAPSVFQAFVDKIFRDLHGQGVVVYIDDILIYFAASTEHVCMVRRVLGRLLEHDLAFPPQGWRWSLTASQLCVIGRLLHGKGGAAVSRVC